MILTAFPGSREAKTQKVFSIQENNTIKAEEISIRKNTLLKVASQIPKCLWNVLYRDLHTNNQGKWAGKLKTFFPLLQIYHPFGHTIFICCFRVFQLPCFILPT